MNTTTTQVTGSAIVTDWDGTKALRTVTVTLTTTGWRVQEATTVANVGQVLTTDFRGQGMWVGATNTKCFATMAEALDTLTAQQAL